MRHKSVKVGVLKSNLEWEIAEISLGKPTDGVKIILMRYEWKHVPNEPGKQLM